MAYTPGFDIAFILRLTDRRVSFTNPSAVPLISAFSGCAQPSVRNTNAAVLATKSRAATGLPIVNVNPSASSNAAAETAAKQGRNIKSSFRDWTRVGRYFFPV